jgi:K+-sensing histidine kinase KdpD
MMPSELGGAARSNASQDLPTESGAANLPVMPSWPKVKRIQKGRRSVLREYLEAFGVVAAVTAVGSLPALQFAYRSFDNVYLLAVIALSLRVGRGPVLAAAVLSGIEWNFFIIPPKYTFRIGDSEDVVIYISFVIVALIAGQLTAQIRAQGEIIGAAREREKTLTASDRLHRALFDSVSHELKTPMAVLRSASWALQKKTTGEGSDLVGEICKATDRLNRLIANLLDQTRLESGTIAPKLDWSDVRDLIQEARRDADYALAGRSLVVEIAPDTPLLRVDAQLTERAVANLLLNAAVHTPPGSTISIRAGVDGHRAFISIADNGPGIPAEIRDHLFQKFQRGAAARTGGSGLGLSIVNGFVSAQGGDVTYADEPGGGARFTIRLPAPPPESVPND